MRWLLFLLWVVNGLVGNVSAQQKPWQPFPFGQVNYYKSLNNGNFYTLSADSSTINASGDTVVFFNRKLYPDESLCAQPGSNVWNNAWTYYHAPFVRDSFRASGDTVWFNAANTYDAPWLFNTATFQRMNLAPSSAVFAWDLQWYDVDLQDTVRRISLFDTAGNLIKADTMRIGKRAGLITWNLTEQHSASPALSNQTKLQLCGYKDPTLSWGFAPPPVERYFDYRSGDIIKMHQQQVTIIPTQYNHQFLRDSVVSVVVTASAVTLNAWRTEQHYDNDSLIFDTARSVSYSYDLDEYRNAAKRTTAFFAPELPDGFIAHDVVLQAVYDSCGADTVLTLKWGGASLQVAACVYVEIPDQNQTIVLTTRRGWTASWMESNMAGGYGGTLQVGYKSPEKGINCGDWLPLGVPFVADNPLRFDVFPNPATHNVILNFRQPVSAVVQLHDATGRLVQSKRINSNALVELDVNALLPSVYFIRVLSNNSVYTGKFVKQ